MKKELKNLNSKSQDLELDSKARLKDCKDNTESKKPLEEVPKLKPILRHVYDSSLGISMVVAVVLGFALGYLGFYLTGYRVAIFIGLAYGILAAILNVYKAYKRLHKDLEELKDDPKYSFKKP